MMDGCGDITARESQACRETWYDDLHYLLPTYPLIIIVQYSRYSCPDWWMLVGSVQLVGNLEA
jgi:hypothetical protein